MSRWFGLQTALLLGIVVGLAGPGGNIAFSYETEMEWAADVLPEYPPPMPSLVEYQKRLGLGPWQEFVPAGFLQPATEVWSDSSPTSEGTQPENEISSDSSSRIPAPETLDLTGRNLSDRVCRSIGAASHGRLANGVKMPNLPGLKLMGRSEHKYGTPETIAGVYYAVASVHQRFPGAHDLLIGDLSRRTGGRLRPHASHQSGRDIDIGYYHKNIDAPNLFVDANSSNLDVERTWALLEALLEDHKVEYIFIDYSVQRLLYNYVKYELGAPESYLAMVFSYPTHSRTSFIRHAPRHRNHIHVRFWSPIAVAAARGVDIRPAPGKSIDPEVLEAYTRGGYVALNRLERVDWGNAPGTGPVKEWQRGYASYRVRQGDTLGAIARRYGLRTSALMAANGLTSRSILSIGQRLRIPQSQLVEVDPPVAVASQNPSAQAKPNSTAVSASRPSTSSSADALVSVAPQGVAPGSAGNGSPATRWERFYLSYRVRPGDYPGKIAKWYGISVDALLKANRLSSHARIYPGQRLKVPQSRQVEVERPVQVASTSPAVTEKSAHVTRAGEGADKSQQSADGTSDSSKNAQYEMIRRTSWVAVRPGDSLWLLARRHGTTVARLCALNNLRRNTVLHVGQRLKLKVWYEKVPVEPAPVLTSQPGGRAVVGGHKN